MTSVLGNVEREKMVIIHSRLPLAVKLVQIAKAKSMMIFWSVSAAMKRKFMA